MNIIQAYLTITRNINYHLPHQKNAHKKTAILAAIALGYATAEELSNTLYIDKEQIRKIVKQLILENLLTSKTLSTWPYRSKYTLTAKGEKMTVNILNYKKPPLSKL